MGKVSNFASTKNIKDNYPINNSKIREIKNNGIKHKTISYKTNKNDLSNQFPYENKTLNNNNNKKLIFLVHKRLHSIDNTGRDELNKIGSNKKHTRNEKDNILKKIQIHYRNFLVEFINIVIIKIIIEECYKFQNLDKIIHLKEYLFHKINYHFKSNIKKEYMKLAESTKIKEIISPSLDLYENINYENKNLLIMKKIESLNNPILNKILNSDYLYFFDIYYSSKRTINLIEGEFNIDLDLDKNIKLFNDLIEKNKNDDKYIYNLKKFAALNFSKGDKNK